MRKITREADRIKSIRQRLLVNSGKAAIMDFDEPVSITILNLFSPIYFDESGKTV